MRVRRWNFYGDCEDSEASNVGAVRLGEMGASNDATRGGGGASIVGDGASNYGGGGGLIRGYPTALPLTKSR